MNIEKEEKWYPIRTKPLQEDIAAFNLSRLNIEVLNPKLQQEKLVWGNPKVILKPLFPSYLFAKFNPTKFLSIIQYTRGVKQILRFGESLVPIEDEIIEEITSRLNPQGYVEKLKKPISAGSKVNIEDGIFSGLSGIFERELSDRKRVVVLLKLMGVQTQVTIGNRLVKPAL